MISFNGSDKKNKLLTWTLIVCLMAVNILFMPFSPFMNKASAATYNITVDYNTVVQTLDQYFNGVNYVAFWDNDQGSIGSREALRRAGVKRLRFPGGEPANWYDWSQPTSWSTTRPIDMWNYAKAVGACVMFQTNPTGNEVGDGYFNNSSGTHAADWVTWAKNNGVNCPVWEVGNEPDISLATVNDYSGFQWYTDKFNEQAPAMKGRDSAIKVSGGVLTNAWYWWGLNTLEMFMTKSGSNADAISIHWYGGDNPTFDSTKGFAQSWQNNWNFIRTKTSKPIYVTEWNSMGQNTGTYGRTIGLAVANSDAIGAFAKTGVAGHCYFGDIHLVDNNWGMFYNTSEGKALDTPTPSYYMLPLWSMMGDKVLNATHNADAANTLNTWAHKKSDGSVQIMVINKSGSNTVNISFNGFNPTGKTVKVYELKAKNGAVTDQDIYYNSVLNPNASTSDLPAPTTANCAGTTFTRAIPAYSVTVLDFPGGTSQSQSPYVTSNIPCKVETENFDNGGEGVAYHDAETANSGGAYRTAEGVDIESGGSNYDVGWTTAGEWMEYTVNVATAGTYNVTFRVASPNSGKSFKLQENDVDRCTVNVPNTGGWQTWTDVTASVSLSAGNRVLKLYCNTDGFNIDYMSFTSQSQAVDIKTECENGTLTSWNIDSTQSSASGGKAIRSTAAANQATFSINIPSSGTYRLYINNSIGTGGWTRTTHMDVDSTADIWSGSLPAANSGETWSNFRLTDLGTASLTAGTHTFKIRHDYYDGYEHLYDYFRLVKQ